MPPTCCPIPLCRAWPLPARALLRYFLPIFRPTALFLNSYYLQSLWTERITSTGTKLGGARKIAPSRVNFRVKLSAVHTQSSRPVYSEKETSFSTSCKHYTEHGLVADFFWVIKA